MTVLTYTGMKRVYNPNHHVPLDFVLMASIVVLRGGNNNYVFDWPCVLTTWSVNIVTYRLGDIIIPMDDHDCICMFLITCQS